MGDSDTATHPLEAVLQAGVDRGAVAGATAVVVDADGVLWEGAVGEREHGSGVAMTNDTAGAIFSMTKAITGAAAIQCVERGQLDLDAPAGDLLEPLANPQVLTGFDGDGQPITRPAVGNITLRNLLTHTSGYVYGIWNADLARWHADTDALPEGSGKRAALEVPLASDPGTRWEYGIGIDWAGLLIEAATGMTLGEHFAENLFGPLAMADMTFSPGDELRARMASMHSRNPDGSLVPIPLPRPQNPEFEAGGGGLYGTMADYGRFIRMVLNDGQLDGNRVMSAESVDLMATNSMGDHRVTVLPSTNPGVSADAEMFPGEEKSWGLTFQIHEQAGRTGRSKGTLSWAGAANSFFWIDRAQGIGGAYMTQMFPFCDPGTWGLYEAFETAAYGAFRG